MQVDPIKLKLKSPGTKRLKLKYDEQPSNFAFKFKLRRFSKGQAWLDRAADAVDGSRAGAYTRPLFDSP